MCTKRSSPSCWRGRACIQTIGRCPSRNASSCWSPNSAPRQAASIERRRRNCPSSPARSWTSWPPPPAPVEVFGPQAVPNYIISMCQSVSDMLEAAILLKEVGLLRRRSGVTEPYAPVGIVPLFETIDDLQRGSSILEAALDLPLYRAVGGCTRRQPGSDARLLRLQQGRRIPGGQLGAVPRRARPGRVGPQDRNPVAALPRSRRHRRSRRRARATTPSWRSRRAR